MRSTRTRSTRTIGLLAVLFAALMFPAVASANSVQATASCDLLTMHVGQTNNMYGTIHYSASDWWVPKTGYYTSNWEYYPFFKPVVTSGDAPHGSFYVGTDANFGHSVWRQDGTFTVWGDASKSLVTKAVAEFTRTTSLVDTTTGSGHTWDDWSRCESSNSWVQVLS